MKGKLAAFALLCLCGLAWLFVYGRGYWYPVYTKMKGKQTVADVVDKYGESAESRLKTAFDDAGMAYPPKEIALLAVKAEKRVELWAKAESMAEESVKQDDGEANVAWQRVKQYDVLAASGELGPKLREGDKQVPEGIYRIIGLNPNSAYHLSMKLNYPNAFDSQWAEKEGRTEPGTNIFIHGKAVSVGCLAMGDPAIEELFVLVNTIGQGNTRVIISPVDPRKQSLVPAEAAQPWVSTLYQNIEEAFLAVSSKR
ncbi:glutamate synthase [NADPH] large chain [Photobacterium aphoticum]|uniref:Glutamate synthase [NADPH] large chain n=1 Tax=Photobacterium aphoticum TaxID=754436 RepID=A0A090QK64_9GAMM|nr:glutamate synthase [NADPH] large chain [Photobacterium aphoticum]